jgi:cytochrome c551/c552
MNPHERIPAVRGLAIVSALILVLAGCGGSGSGGAAGKSTSAAAAAKSGSKYDSGPRAGEQEADDELAEKGEALFSTKGCTACHAHGRKLTGPDLAGVSMRRTHEWMEHQILDPGRMVQEDPISRELMAKHALAMPNQGLTPDEAKAVIEYLKHHDQEAGLAPAAED